MDASRLKTKYRLSYEDLPNQNGLNIVYITGLDTEEYQIKENGRTVKRVRHLLYFRELKLPLALNNGRIDVISSLHGTETDNWIGKPIGLFVGQVTHYGETKADILIHIRPVGPVTPQIAGNSIAATPSPQLPGETDLRPIGEANAQKFKAALAEQGATVDDAVAWFKREAPDIHSATWDKMLADWPRYVAPSMQRFLREFQSSKAAPVIAGAGQPPDDDIPF